MKALILAPFDEPSLERLARQFDVVYEPWTQTRRLHDPADLARRLRDERVTAVVVEADFLVRDAFAAPGLRIAGACRNAVTQVDLAAASERGVPVLHAPARNNVAVAELAIGFMLALARHIPRAHAFVSGGRWTNPVLDYEQFRGREVAGSVVGVVGLGQIGREVARRALALGARVIAADPFVKSEAAGRLGVRLVSLPALLRRADFVTLHTAQLKQPVIDAGALDLMKPSAYLINTGAPGAIDYDALAERLQSRRIAGAALDVYPGFILPASSPLLALDNVILTPHMGGATVETVARHSRMMTQDIERFLRGERPRNVVNPEALARAAHAR